MNGSQILVIGVGNEYRSDDVIGLQVARNLRNHSLLEAKIVEQSGEGSALMGLWEKVDTVIIIDAAKTNSELGTIHRLDPIDSPLPKGFLAPSTHAFGVVEAIELSRTLGTLPNRMVLYGIEGRDFSIGEDISPEVKFAAALVEDLVLLEIESLESTRSSIKL